MKSELFQDAPNSCCAGAAVRLFHRKPRPYGGPVNTAVRRHKALAARIVMVSKDSDRLKRLADFELRKLGDTANVFVVSEYKWEYIPIHPMANETDWLKRHGLKPIDCTRVDCYWRMNDDVVFLQVHSVKNGWTMSPGLYARWDNKDIPMLYIDAVIEESFISQRDIEIIMIEIGAIHLRCLVVIFAVHAAQCSRQTD